MHPVEEIQLTADLRKVFAALCFQRRDDFFHMLKLPAVAVDLILQRFLRFFRCAMHELRNADPFKVQRGEHVVHISLIFLCGHIQTPAVSIILAE